jgi:hypothetical protein
MKTAADGMQRSQLTWERGHGTGSDGLGRLLDLDETHAAVSSDGESAMVAEARDVDAGDLAGLEHGEPLGDPHRMAIHEYLERVLRVGRKLHAGASNGLPRRRQLQVGRRHRCAGLRRTRGGGRGDPTAGGSHGGAARRQAPVGLPQRPREKRHGGGGAMGSNGDGRERGALDLDLEMGVVSSVGRWPVTLLRVHGVSRTVREWHRGPICGPQ